MREDQPWSFLYNYSKWKLLLLSCLKFLWWDKLNNRFTIYTTTSCWINLLTYKHTRVRTETLTIHLIYEESGMNCYVLCATILHPAIVYLDPQNYNINFKVSRSFLYKGSYNRNNRYWQLYLVSDTQLDFVKIPLHWFKNWPSVF